MTEQQPIEPSEAPQSGEGPAPSEGLQQAEPTEDPQVDTSPFEPPEATPFESPDLGVLIEAEQGND